MFYTASLRKVTFGADVVEVPNSFCCNAYQIQEVVFLGTKVTTIGLKAFYGCKNLATCTLPDSVTTIGEQALRLSGITTLTIPKAVTSIGNQAFQGMTKLEKIIFNATAETVTMPSTDFPPFDNTVSSELEEGTTFTVEFGEGVTAIPNYMFCYLTKLTEITIPTTITKFGEGCFRGSGLTSFTFPEGCAITEVPKAMFNGCKSLTEVKNIPTTVTKINASAFRDTLLTSFKIHEGVTKLESMVFCGCTLLKVVELPSTLTEIGPTTFDGVTLDTLVLKYNGVVFAMMTDLTMSENGHIYVPSDQIEKYKKDYDWKEYAAYIVSLDTYSASAAVSYELPEAILPEKKN